LKPSLFEALRQAQFRRSVQTRELCARAPFPSIRRIGSKLWLPKRGPEIARGSTSGQESRQAKQNEASDADRRLPLGCRKGLARAPDALAGRSPAGGLQVDAGHVKVDVLRLRVSKATYLTATRSGTACAPLAIVRLHAYWRRAGAAGPFIRGGAPCSIS